MLDASLDYAGDGRIHPASQLTDRRTDIQVSVGLCFHDVVFNIRDTKEHNLVGARWETRIPNPEEL